MAKNEAKIKFTAETGEFNSSIKKSNNELSKLRAELKLNEAQTKNTGESVESLEQKQKILGNQLEVAQDKTHALNLKLDKAVECFGENSEEVTKLERQLANARAEEEKIQSAINLCNTELKQQADASEKAESATGQLTDKIAKQETELNKLKDEYVEAVLKFGDASDEAKKLEREISDLSGELKESKTAFDNAKDKADEFDRSLDDVGDSAANTEGGFTIMKGTISDLASEAIQFATEKISEFISYLLELPEATREIRQDMATLDTSFERQGFTNKQALQTWKDLYTIFGEDDRAVEAANLIAKMSSNQEELNSWVTITKGVWGSYQDSLPVEGLAESSNETAKVGKVTGVLADALNWSSEAAVMFAGYMSEDVVTAEDAFNEALKKCTTEEERQALITETLTSLYSGAADSYEKASGSQLEAKEATAENTLVQNELANAIEPVTTAWQNLKNNALNAVLPLVQSVTGFLTENEWVLKTLQATIMVVTGALAALLVVGAAFLVYIAWLPMAIIAAISLIVAFWDEIKAFFTNLWQSITETFSKLATWLNSNVVQPIVSFFTSLWQSLKNIWDNICNVVQFAFLLIGSIISAAVNIITLPFRFIWENCKDSVFKAFEWMKSKIRIAIDFIKNLAQKGFNLVKEKIVNPLINARDKAVEIFNKIRTSATEKITALKDKVTSIFNTIKEKITTPITNAKNKAVEIFNNIKSSVTSKIDSLKSSVTSKFNAVKDKMISPIEKARDKIKGIVDRIKGFFSNLKLKLPNIKLPHFSISGSFSLNPPSVPKLSIDWYKDGGIMTHPTIFGVNGNRLMAGGESGPEAILPIDRLQGYVSDAVERSMQVANIQSLARAVEDLANRPIELYVGDRQIALATAGANDSVNGLRSSFKSLGLVLD